MRRPISVAVDLGAESCRVSLLRWVDDEPRIDLVHRFPNIPILESGKLRWNLRAITGGIKKGLRRSADLASGARIASIGIDGWAVDYVRLGVDGAPIADPYCYRDERTIKAEKEVYETISAESLYRLTGIQLLRLNTLFQLYADNYDGISQSTPWQNLPEYVTHWLGGERIAEYTNATHTQLVALGKREWCTEIFEATGLNLRAAPCIAPAGTDIGCLRADLLNSPSFHDTRLIVPACHDTASAIAGIPLKGDDWAFISSGTWSLVGTVLDQPCATDEARGKNFTNLGGAGGKACFLKNVNGMWLLRQCMEHWQSLGYRVTISDLVDECAGLAPPDLPVDVDDSDLLLPGHMPDRINAQRKRLGFRPIPNGNLGSALMTNAIFHGLARRYAEVLSDVQAVVGKRLKRLCIVGGGSKNSLLNRLTAEFTGLNVVLGAAESSTIGNFAVQLATLSGECDPEVGAKSAAIARWAGVLSKSMDMSEAEVLTTVQKG